MDNVLVTYVNGEIERFEATRTYIEGAFYIIVVEDGHTIAIPNTIVKTIEAA